METFTAIDRLGGAEEIGIQSNIGDIYWNEQEEIIHIVNVIEIEKPWTTTMILAPIGAASAMPSLRPL
jgi:hypothetical protein